MWLLPVLTGPIAALTLLTIAPLLMSLLLRQLWVRGDQMADEHHVDQMTVGGT
jgi:hypothetical protein